MLNRWKTFVAMAVLCWLPAARGATIPDLPEGTVVQVREGDVWSDVTFLRKEGHRALIRYSDGTEEWVTAERFRVPAGTPLPPSDDSTAAGSGSSSSPTPDSASSGLSTSSAGSSISNNSAGPAVPTPLPNHEIIIDVDDAPQSHENVDAASLSKPVTPPKQEFIHFGVQSTHFQGFSEPFLRCADTPTIYFSKRGQDQQTTLGRIDITTHDMVGNRTIPVKAEEVRGVGSGGKYIATVTTVNDVSTLKQWVNESGSYHVRASVKLVSSKGKFEYGKVWPIGPDRLIVDKVRDGLYLINLPQARVEAFCKHSWDDPDMTPDGQTMMVRQEGNLLLLRTSDLSIAASVPASNSFGRFAVDPSCTYMAYSAQDRLHIVTIATGDEVGKIILGPGSGDVYLLSADYVAVDHNQSLDIYDIKSGYPFWSYQRDRLPHCQLLANGQFLLGFEEGPYALVTLPDPKAIASLKTLSPDKYALSPGTAIALKGDPAIFNSADSEVKAAVKDTLEKSGHTLGDDSSACVLNWTSAAGPTVTKKFYHTVMPGSPIGVGAPMDVSIPSTLVTVTLTLSGQTIWTRILTFKAPDYMRIGTGQTAQDVANASAKPTIGWLHNLGIPPFLLKGATADAPVSSMVSKITSSGIVAGDLVSKPPRTR